ncbi:MAG TPA: hypothetical protein VJZ06_04520 [Mobilitalea sp.]|nr:hypothetical protein [Mobilitalea sp.]
MMIMTAAKLTASGMEDYASLTVHGGIIRDVISTEDMRIEIVMNAGHFLPYFLDLFDNNTVLYTSLNTWGTILSF